MNNTLGILTSLYSHFVLFRVVYFLSVCIAQKLDRNVFKDIWGLLQVLEYFFVFIILRARKCKLWLELEVVLLENHWAFLNSSGSVIWFKQELLVLEDFSLVIRWIEVLEKLQLIRLHNFVNFLYQWRHRSPTIN